MFSNDSIAHSITELRSSMADPNLKKKMKMEKNETLLKLEVHYCK